MAYSIYDEQPELFSGIPSPEVDPQELERAKYMAMIRMGLGVAGREPLGSAAGAGMKAYLGVQQQARQMMLAKMQAYKERQQIEAVARQEYEKKKWLDSMTAEQRKKYGITDEVWGAYQALKDPAGKFVDSDLTKPYTLQPGQPRVIPGVGVVGQAASPEGYMGYYEPGSAEQSGRYVVTGAPEAASTMARATEYGKGLGQAATQLEDAPVPGGEPGDTEKVLRSKLIEEQTAPPNKTQIAAAKNIAVLDGNLKEEVALLAEATSKNDPAAMKRHGANIEAIKSEAARWEKYGGRRINSPLSVKRAEARIPKLETGYEYAPDGSQRPAKGGPEDTSIVQAQQITSYLDRSNSITAALNKAVKQVGWNTAGLGGQVALKIPGSPATDLARTLAEIKAHIGFSELTAMRETSKTGGALGQVAVEELKYLQSTLGSLEQDQSPSQLRENLQKVADSFGRARVKLEALAEEKRRRAGPAAVNLRTSSNDDPLGLRGGGGGSAPRGGQGGW